MWETLQKIQEKPKHVRQGYALGVSFGITALIALVWASSLGSSLSQGVLVEETEKSAVKPLAAVVESVREGAEEFKIFFERE